MLEINLLPVREERRKADVRQYLTQVALIFLLVLCGIGLTHSQINEKINSSERRIRQMEHDIDQFKPQLEQVEAFKKRKASLEKKIDVIDGLDRARRGPVQILSELADRTPDRLWLTEMSTKGGKITLTGKSLDNELVALFLRNLNASEFFQNVDLDSTKLGDEAGLKVVSFKIDADLVDPSRKTAEAATPAKPKRAES